MNRRSFLAAYLRQQKEMGMPDMVSEHAEKIRSIIAQSQAKNDSGGKAAENPKQSKSPYARLSRLRPMASGVKEREPLYGGGKAALLTFEGKRVVFKEMYSARCGRCALAKTRKTFVFGAGNVDAPLMIIGEAPGSEEDEQGLPFVGAAGRLLTGLLEAVALDRKKDVFITNILKCRPPDNRTPDAEEVALCLPLVRKQIEVIAPRLLLLLGRVAAHALLGNEDGIGKLRGRVHEYRGIPVVVTYHPAALLRTSEYRGPTEDDLRTAARLLKGQQ